MSRIIDQMNPAADSEQVRVWDISVRIFHWLLVSAFAVAYITEEDFLDLHTWAGYLIMGLLAYRLVWGLIGPQYARFSDFVYAPGKVLQHLKDTLRFKAPRYLGHNPAGGAMIIALLLSLIFTTVTGVALLGADEHAGPLAGLMAGSGEWVEDALEEVHEFFANFTLFLVFIHVGGVLWESFVHGENLPRSMFTGRKNKA
jgi:cytochrome b